MIKTGILCVPAYDEAASDAVRRLLHNAMPALIIWADRYAAGQRYLVEELLRHWCDEEELDLILTIGGALPAPGPSAHEIVPEATLAVIERALPGLPEAMRAYGAEETPLALLDRGAAGIRGRTVIVNLPAGENAAALFLAAIVDVLAPIIAHLQEDATAPTIAAALEAAMAEEKPRTSRPTMASPGDDIPPSRPSTPLNSDEFAEFLRRRTSGA